MQMSQTAQMRNGATFEEVDKPTLPNCELFWVQFIQIYSFIIDT